MSAPLRPRAAAALIALLASGCSPAPTKAPEPPAAKVEGERITYPANAPQLAYLTIEQVQPRKVSISHLTGRLYLADDATVRVFTPVAGQVAALRADVGQRVSRGDALADIHSPDYDQALADARTSDANLLAAEKALARERDLLEHGAAAAKDVESAQASYSAAAAERARAASRLSLYHGSADGTDQVYVLRSPISGEVVERNLNAGQEVRADQMLANATNLFAPLFVVSDTSRLWLQVDATESDLAELRDGQRIRVSSNAFPGRTFEGTVTNISPTLDPATRTVRVRAVVDNPDHVLKAEMYVAVDVLRDPSRVAGAGFLVPSKSIFTVDRVSYLFVAQAPGQFERRRVEIGAEKDGMVPVTSGLTEGTRVVSDGGLLLEAVLEPDN